MYIVRIMKRKTKRYDLLELRREIYLKYLNARSDYDYFKLTYWTKKLHDAEKRMKMYDCLLHKIDALLDRGYKTISEKRLQKMIKSCKK